MFPFSPGLFGIVERTSRCGPGYPCAMGSMRRWPWPADPRREDIELLVRIALAGGTPGYLPAAYVAPPLTVRRGAPPWRPAGWLRASAWAPSQRQDGPAGAPARDAPVPGRIARIRRSSAGSPSAGRPGGGAPVGVRCRAVEAGPGGRRCRQGPAGRWTARSLVIRRSVDLGPQLVDPCRIGAPGPSLRSGRPAGRSRGFRRAAAGRPAGVRGCRCRRRLGRRRPAAIAPGAEAGPGRPGAGEPGGDGAGAAAEVPVGPARAASIPDRRAAGRRGAAAARPGVRSSLYPAHLPPGP
ncbi:hypothetical protein HBB16_16265 [Pseudonocardia sp. MCCB 268]|nr:hypothetical protein [Pseudonocardia cytotoxica]